LRYLSVGPANDGYGTRVMGALLARHVHAAMRSDRPDVVISDDTRFLLPYVAAGRLCRDAAVTAPWLHGFQGNRIERIVCANSSCVLSTNQAMLEDVEAAGALKRPAFVTGNPVPQELVEFGRSHSRADSRRRVGLDLERPLIAYTGKLFGHMKELDYLLQAAARLPDFLFVLTGGQPPVIAELRERLRAEGRSNVRLTGMLKDPNEARFYQKSADVLVSYYSTEDHPFAYQQLPAKLAEYMASGNAIVAADFPAARELLNSGNSFLVEPHNMDAFVHTLNETVENSADAKTRGAQAQRDIAGRTSEAVAAELVQFFSGLEGRAR